MSSCSDNGFLFSIAFQDGKYDIYRLMLPIKQVLGITAQSVLNQKSDTYYVVTEKTRLQVQKLKSLEGKTVDSGQGHASALRQLIGKAETLRG